MYAIIETGGKQYRVQPEDIIEVEKLNINKGDSFEINEVLMVSDDDNIEIGNPYVTNATVQAELLDHGKGDKIIVYKYKPKKKYRRKQGHRQPFSQIKITGISLNENPSEQNQDIIEETKEITETVD